MPSTIFDLHEEFTEQTFEDLDARELVISDRQFFNCVFTKCCFIGAELKNCKFIDCVFKGCDLSNARVRGTSFRDTAFQSSKLMGLSWTEAATLAHPRFETCNLDFSNFVGLDLRKSAITESVAREADFAQANLSEARLTGTDFAGARFSNTNLSKADLRNAINYSIRPNENKITKARFSLPEATTLLYGLDILLEE